MNTCMFFFRVVGATEVKLLYAIMKIHVCVQYGSFSSQQAKKDDRETVDEVEAYADQSRTISDVETDLFIGLPDTRTRRINFSKVED